MKIESIKHLLNQRHYKDFLLNLNQISINKNYKVSDKIVSIVENGEYLYEGGISINNRYGVGILIPANWETEILGKKCAKLFILYGTDYAICLKILKTIHTHVDKLYWVQYDSQLSDSYVEIALEKSNYYIGTQYYQWIGDVKNINYDKLKFSDRFNIKLAEKKDADEICKLTRKFPDPGRFVADPFLKEEGKELYAAWAYNSCVKSNSSSDEILICKTNDKIIGYETISYDKTGKSANLGILRINSNYTGKLLGYAILAASIKKCIDADVEVLTTRTSKFNVAVNRIYKELGFIISESSIQFHWTDKKGL